ncbi:MAG: energy transducer TonB [Acidobacteriota bacterium]
MPDRHHDVYSALEIAAAAGVPAGVAEVLVGPRLVPWDEAVSLVKSLRGSNELRLLSPEGPQRTAAVPLVVSTTLHGLAAGLALMLASLGSAAALEKTQPLMRPSEPLRLVFLAQPGPGGGGGGGGLRMPAPPPKAERTGTRRLSSPIPARPTTPPYRPPPRVTPPPPPIASRRLPPVEAPVAAAPSDARDRAGVLSETHVDAPSSGPGTGGGTGTGLGAGIGEGSGGGIGAGEGGGIGGGPYRPGSGVEPPRLIREVRADYTEEARRAGLSGEVLLELVVRRDGTVGDVRLVRGLGGGLDAEAIRAVRQWRFAPARMTGTPVDVLVEVAVEFRLR